MMGGFDEVGQAEVKRRRCQHGGLPDGRGNGLTRWLVAWRLGGGIAS